MGHQSYVLLCFQPSEGVNKITFGSICSRSLCLNPCTGSVLLQFHEFSNYICFVFQQLPGQYSADVSVEEEVGNYLTAEVPSGSGRRGSFRGSRISSVGHSHSGSMDLMETGSLPSGFR